MPDVIRIFTFNCVSQTLMVRNGSYLLNFQTNGGSLPLKGKVSTRGEKRSYVVFAIL